VETVLYPTTLPPSKEELGGRLAKVRKLMIAQDLDVYVSFDPVNIYYLTNFANIVHERPFILVIPKAGLPQLLCPLLETNHAKVRAECELEYVNYDEFPAPEGENWYDGYRALIEIGARVGMESSVPIGIYEKTPGSRIVTDIISEARLVKSDYEISRTIHACQVVDLGHEKLLEVCRPEVREDAISREIVGVMHDRMFADIPNANSSISNIWGAVWPPSLSHDPHNLPPLSTVMEEGGPHVSIVIAQVDGYGVELERTFFLGKVPEEAKRPFETMLEARALAYELARPGVNMGQIDEAVRAVIIDRGYGDFILHRTGHGLGITGHEAPYLAQGYDRELAPGMLISIEPAIYIPGVGGFRHSDSILITHDGSTTLTHAPDTLEDLRISL
jgi:Xaa-Pro aminopeptidase